MPVTLHTCRFTRHLLERTSTMKVVTFGEVMMRLATPGFLRLNQASVLEMTFGGGEANVAVSLALFGEEAAFVTRLPKNDVAEACIQKLRGLGVDTTHDPARRRPHRHLFPGKRRLPARLDRHLRPRPQRHFRDQSRRPRSGTTILKGADWFHFTGITPALSDAAAQASLEGARAAKKLGLTVSCDLNFRKKLWSSEKAGKVMAGLMEHVDICIANEEDAEKVFGIKASGDRGDRGQDRPQPLRRSREEADRAVQVQGRGHHAARKLFRLAQRLVRRSTSPAARSTSAAATISRSSTASAAAIRSRRA